jgi:hypothetical protein
MCSMFASRDHIGPLPVSADIARSPAFVRAHSYGANPCTPYPMAYPVAMAARDEPLCAETAHVVEEMSADELLDMLSACL